MNNQQMIVQDMHNNSGEFTAAFAAKAGIDKEQAKRLIEAFKETVTEMLVAGRNVVIWGLVDISVKVRHARMGVNPQHPTEKIQIPEVKVVKFKAGRPLKNVLKGKV